MHLGNACYSIQKWLQTHTKLSFINLSRNLPHKAGGKDWNKQKEGKEKNLWMVVHMDDWNSSHGRLIKQNHLGK